ncbi:MAG: hypothetical protein OHK0029_29900 [Armatimonadaceae bacterium]
MDDIAAIVAISLIFGGIPISAILTYHLRKIAEIKARASGGNTNEIRQELQAIRQEMAELRDTSTRFDMSFDAAISRLEQRMDRNDEILHQVAPQTYRAMTEEAEDVTVQVRR